MLPAPEIDQALESAIDACDDLLGFAREGDTLHWCLMLADETWLDITIDDNGLPSLSAEIGRVTDAQGAAPLNELMLRCAYVIPGSSFSLDEEGMRQYRQCLSHDTLAPDRLKDSLLGFVSRVQAWRRIVAAPEHDRPQGAPDNDLPLMAWPVRG